MENASTAKKFNTCKIKLKNFDIYSKIVFTDAGQFFRYPSIIGPASPDGGVDSFYSV